MKSLRVLLLGLGVFVGQSSISAMVPAVTDDVVFQFSQNIPGFINWCSEQLDNGADILVSDVVARVTEILNQDSDEICHIVNVRDLENSTRWIDYLINMCRGFLLHNDIPAVKLLLVQRAAELVRLNHVNG